MPIDLIKYAHVGGEIAENYHGRSDLEKYDLALELAENYYAEYQGGLANCPGTIFVDFLREGTRNHKFVPFVFSTNVANTNLIIFGHEYIWFLQNGALVLEDAQPVDQLFRDNPTTVRVPGHGYETGDWVQFPTTGSWDILQNRSFVITKIDANRFSLATPLGVGLDSVNEAAFSGGATVARIYTIPTTYQSSDLSTLCCTVVRDLVRITHTNYPIYNLRRFGQAEWTFEEEITYSQLERPSGIEYEKINSGNYNMAYVVTWVNEKGEESLPSEYTFAVDVSDIENNLNAAIMLRWDSVAGAKYYNIYRSRIVYGDNIISRSFETGYVGQSKGAYFADPGITPDFTRTPPVGRNPFAHSSITQIDVLTPGTGYPYNTTMTITDASLDAGGFVGYPVVNQNNDDPSLNGVAGVYIISEGHEYTAPVIALSAGGTGATFEATLGESTGNWPALSAIYHQRMVYASTENNPLTIYGSRPGQYSNFNESTVLVANDAYEHEIDSDNQSSLRHIMAVRGGLLAFSGTYIWLISGSNNNAITATDVQADLQVEEGASFVKPIRVGTDILYCDPTGASVKALAYADNYKLYKPLDVSVLANHLFGKDKSVVSWTYAAVPHKLIHAVRADGTMLLFTMDKDQEIYAWTRRTTQGRFEEVASYNERNNAVVYVAVERTFPDGTIKCLEKVAPRTDSILDDGVFLDCSLSLSATYPNTDLTVSAATGDNITCVASSAVFAPGDVDKVIRGGGGKLRVVSYVSDTEITANVIEPITELSYVSGTATPKPFIARTWSLDAEVNSVGGLWHLEGMSVTMLADGNVYRDQVVTDGTITLAQAASRVTVGLSYVCIAKQLPATMQRETIEGKEKRVVGLMLRVRNTRGLKVGTRMEKLYSIKAQSGAVWGDAAGKINGLTHIAVQPQWGRDGSVYFVQEDPLPVTILGTINKTEVGDDND